MFLNRCARTATLIAAAALGCGNAVDVYSAQACWMVQIGHYRLAQETVEGMREVTDPSCRMIPHGLGARVVCGCYANESLALQALPDWQQRFYNTVVISPEIAYHPAPPPRPHSYFPVLLVTPPLLDRQLSMTVLDRS